MDFGANEAATRKAEDRNGFKNAREEIGLDVPRSHLAYNFDEALLHAREIGFPLVVRPSYTLGGTGGGIAWDEFDFARIAQAGLQASRISEILIEEWGLGDDDVDIDYRCRRATCRTLLPLTRTRDTNGPRRPIPSRFPRKHGRKSRRDNSQLSALAAGWFMHNPGYETEDEAGIDTTKKVIILCGGPNRIGQGIEFDYCCCQAVFGFRELGYQTIMVNSNPETVSTDYDTADRLYFEPLTFEDVMNIIDKEYPAGVVVQLGGQTPLNLAQRLTDAGTPILGTSVGSINRAEDRNSFAQLIPAWGCTSPPMALLPVRK